MQFPGRRFSGKKLTLVTARLEALGLHAEYPALSPLDEFISVTPRFSEEGFPYAIKAEADLRV